MSMDYSLSLQSLRSRYQSGSLTLQQMIRDVLERIGQDEHHCWITVLSEAQLNNYADALRGKDPAVFPLYGVPFAVKDNIDLAGVPTTAGCPDYTYTPARSAFVVQRLMDAGAIPIGKTNMDQFATGLVGTRSPYGITLNPFNKDYISGGSSSGSAVAVSLGVVSFALGTDTAGSGRVPAAYNNIIGLKPTRGLLSTQGVVPACRTLDCVSIFALGIDDVNSIYSIAREFDRNDSWARKPEETGAPAKNDFKFGIPESSQLNFFGNDEYQRLYEASIKKWELLGGKAVVIDYQPFAAAARLLYEGPWLAERYVAIRDLIENNPDAIHPVVKNIIAPAIRINAVDTFTSLYELQKLKQLTDQIMEQIAFLLLPTAGTIYTITDVISDPVKLNSNLGYYTNFINLLDYSGIALPAGFTGEGLPFGITLVARAFAEPALLGYAGRYLREYQYNIGATAFKTVSDQDRGSPIVDYGHTINIVVCGAHMSGMALNQQLTDRGALLNRKTRTTGKYRLFALAGGPPNRPGLMFDDKKGSTIDVEVWALPKSQLADFVSLVPAPLGFGRIELEDGSNEFGFICEPRGFEGAEEITALGSWRTYLQSKQ